MSAQYAADPPETPSPTEAWVAIDDITKGGKLYAAWAEAEDGRRYLSGLCITGIPITADLLRSIRVGQLGNRSLAVNGATLRGDPNQKPGLLRREPGEDPESFSERVAVHYRALCAVTSTPAKTISDTSGVPLPTVHGWIREARLRGKLPPGRRGKAG